MITIGTAVTAFFLALHVVAAILAVGPVAVAASMFPRVARGTRGQSLASGPGASLATLHRICRVYAALGLSVPALGFVTANLLGVVGQVWVIVSVVLTAAAGVLLALVVLPGQSAVLAALGGAAADGPPTPSTDLSRLAMATGVFNLLWLLVTVLMIVRPGSTTGV